jgi:gamma-glutamylcyclotransferase (GGCT)/AIG2-like uncharacterized protein YtfP
VVNRLETVFVYGTLRHGEYNHTVAEPFIVRTEPGVVRGYLYDVGPYPALVLDANGRDIIGEWLTVTEEGLKAMDRLEGYRGSGSNNFYERVWVRDAYSEQEGWVYVWHNSKGYPEIFSGDWKNREMGSG